jgi:hypothetical protein
MSREQIVRDTAYAIWEAEGKPEGRSSDHWQQAEARVAASVAPGASQPKAAVKGMPAAKPAIDAQEKPPAKAAAAKAAPKARKPAN